MLDVLNSQNIPSQAVMKGMHIIWDDLDLFKDHSNNL